MTETRLEVKDLRAWYGKAQVLHGVDFMVEAGEIVALLGRNGSGRSTAAKAIVGLVDAAGSVRWRGRELLGCKPFQIARLGIGYVPEDRQIFPRLSVAQNLMLGEQRGKRRWKPEDFYRRFPVLGARRDTAAGLLSGGEQQMLALCRTLIGEPALLVVDEPTEGLAPQLVREVGDFLRELAAEGLGVLLVEQKLAIALEISDRALLMGHGRIVFDGEPQRLLADDALRREWLEV